MVLSRLTKITGPGVATDTNWVGNNADFTGITTTATSFNIGVTTIHSNLIEAHNIKSTGIVTATGGSFSGNVTAVDGTFTGNVSIAGTLTYEDVTNIDSVGIITAPALDVDDFLDVGSNIKLGNAGVITATSFVGSGAALTGIDATAIKDSGGNVKVQAQASGAVYTGIHTFSSGAEVGSNIKLGNAGVVTATSFTGSGANLTSLPAGQLTGTVADARISTLTASKLSGALPAISGANLTNLDASDLASGTVPTARLGSGTANSSTFLRGDSTFAAVTSTTINNNAANKVIMGSNTANTLEAVAKSTLFGNLSHGQNFLDDQNLVFGDASDMILIHQASGAKSRIRNTNDSGSLDIESTLTRFTNKDGSTEKLRIDSSGNLIVNVNTAAAGGYTYKLLTSDNISSSEQTFGIQYPAVVTYGLNAESNADFTIKKDGAERLRIDSSGRLLLGTTDTHGSDADDMVIATSGTTGITIRSGTSASGNIYFADGNSGTSLYRGRVSYNHGDDSLFLGTANANNSLKISSDGRIGLRHDLSGTADYNRMMIYNPNSGSCWIQLMSTATGNSANTDGLSIGLNTSNIAHIWQRENAEMQFATNNSLRWRITSSGDVYPQGNYKIGLNSNTAFRMDEVNSNKFVHRYGNSGSATTNQQEAIWYGGGITVMHDNQTLQTTNYTWGLTGARGYPIFRLKNASGQAIYAESGSISSGSDYRMKENIEEITNGIETVKKLKPSIYNIRKSFNPLDNGKKHHGFIAHEVQEAIPDIANIVSGTKDGMEEVFYGVDEDEVIPEGKKAGDSTGTFTDNPDMQGIDYGHMTPVLAAAIKELITKVETLETKVATLEGS